MSLMKVEMKNDNICRVQADELAFAGQTRADDTDMEAFRALYDSNDDGKFTAADAKWSKARVWQDQDQDGAVDAGEMRTLGQASLTSIGLVSNGREQTVAGNTIAGLSKATFADGRTSDVADAMLDATDIGLKQTRGGYRIEIDGGNDVFVAGGATPVRPQCARQGLSDAGRQRSRRRADGRPDDGRRNPRRP